MYIQTQRHNATPQEVANFGKLPSSKKSYKGEFSFYQLNYNQETMPITKDAFAVGHHPVPRFYFGSRLYSGEPICSSPKTAPQNVTCKAMVKDLMIGTMKINSFDTAEYTFGQMLESNVKDIRGGDIDGDGIYDIAVQLETGAVVIFNIEVIS